MCGSLQRASISPQKKHEFDYVVWWNSGSSINHRLDPPHYSYMMLIAHSTFFVRAFVCMCCFPT